jgi:hypothetical protein
LDDDDDEEDVGELPLEDRVGVCDSAGVEDDDDVDDGEAAVTSMFGIVISTSTS